MLNTKINPEAEYYREWRPGLLEIVRGAPGRVLEIGCASGQTLVYFKTRGANFVAGVEIVPEVARISESRKEIDRVLVGNIEKIDLGQLGEDFDLIIASHVLEHLVDPWLTLKKLKEKLKPEGQLIGALPNLRHFSVTFPLLVRGHWQYTESGLLDWTHLRFFTRQTIQELLNTTGFQIDKINPELRGPKSRVFNKLTLALFQSFLTYSYNFSAFKPGL